jgi:hypothetical protein
MHDYEAHCGYFLNAEIEFGKSLPDIIHAWMAQAGYIRSKLKEAPTHGTHRNFMSVSSKVLHHQVLSHTMKATRTAL